MAVISTLAVSIRANADKFIGAMKKVQGVISRVTGAMGRIAKSVVPVALAFAGLSGISLVSTIEQTRKLGDEVGKLSDEIGIGVNELFALRKAAELTGTTTAILTSGLQRMNRRIGEANDGYGEAVKGLSRLGLAASDLAGMSAFEQFKTIADRVSELGTQADKAAATYTLFGRQGSKLMNMFALQGKGIDEILKRTIRLQGAFSRLDLRQIEAMNDRVVDLKTAMQGFTLRALVGLAPQLAGMVELMTEGFITLREKVLPGLLVKQKEVFGAMLDWIVRLSPVVVALGQTIVWLGKVAFNIIRTIGEGFASIGTLLSDLVGDNTLLRDAFGIETLGEEFVGMVSLVRHSIDGIISSFVKFGTASQGFFLSIIKGITGMVKVARERVTNMFTEMFLQFGHAKDELIAFFDPRVSKGELDALIKRNHDVMANFFADTEKSNAKTWDNMVNDWANAFLELDKLTSTMKDFTATLGEDMIDKIAADVEQFKKIRDKLQEAVDKIKTKVLDFDLPQVEINPNDRDLLKKLFAPAAEFGSQEAAKILASVQPSTVREMAEIADDATSRGRSKDKSQEVVAENAPKQTNLLTGILQELKDQSNKSIEVVSFA
jgi:hypothetical protein